MKFPLKKLSSLFSLTEGRQRKVHFDTFYTTVSSQDKCRHIQVPYLGILPRKPPPIHAENQIQDMSPGSFGLTSIQKFYGLHGSVKHDGMHESVKPIEGLSYGSVLASVDSIPSNNSNKKHQKLSYSDIMR